MTEDGRKTGMAALRSLSPGLIRVGTNQTPNWTPLRIPCGRVGLQGSCCARIFPRSQRQDREHPPCPNQSCRPAIRKIWLLEEITHENVSRK
jgi:hypothetical protein